MSEESGWRSTPKDLREAPRSPERRSTADLPEIYEFGPFRLEPFERKLLRGDEVVALTPKAFDTLHLLVRNSDHLLKKDELIRVLWPDSVVEEGNLTNNIFQLRKALGQDPEYIETVPRIGYRFIGAVRRLPTPERARPETRLLRPLSGVSDSAGGQTPDRGEAPVRESAFPLGLQSSSRRAAVIISACALAILVAGYMVLGRLSHRGVAATSARMTVPAAEKAIAVLPFIDLSERHDQEYFADGMAEEVIDLLGRIPGLRVISRTSSFQFKGRNQDVRAVGSTLGVSYLVEGSVRKSADQLRVTAQLISAVDGSHLWSNTYDEPVGDALKVQDEIASNLVRALQVSVGAADYRGRPSFKTLEAYDLYLRGLHAVDKYDKEGFESATAYFQRVLDLDPASAPAAERLALTQMLIAVYGYLEPREAFERARLSAQRALKLDPKSSAAYHVLSVVQYQYEWNWADAERNAKEALRLNPGDAEANGNLGNVYWILGRWAEATRLYETAVSLDPLFVHWRVQLLDAQYSDGRLREAEAEARRVLQISPTFDGGHTMVGRVLLAQGKLEPALAEMQQDQSSWGLALVYYAMGRRAESDAALAQLIQDHAQDSASDIAYVYAYRQDLDQVFAWLDRAYNQKDVQLCDIKASQIDPLVKHYTHDPRFTAFLRKMNLPE